MHPPLPAPQLTEKEKARFFSRFERAANGCWEWRARISPRGYGIISLRGRGFRAHRLSYWIHRQVDPGEAFVCHACDNRKCVNPDHLWLGDAMANARDMIAKGRGRHNTPETHGHLMKLRTEKPRVDPLHPSQYDYPTYCQTCGHHRIDDYVERSGRRRCRPCNARRCAERKRRSRAKNS